MEHQAELAATNKFNSMLNSLKSEWAQNEEHRVRTIEERARVDVQVEIATLKAELATTKKMANDTQTKWMDVVTKQNYEHHDALELFAEKCRKTYDDKLAAMTERIAQQFGMYERQLLESDKDLTEQAMNFENKVSPRERSENSHVPYLHYLTHSFTLVAAVPNEARDQRVEGGLPSPDRHHPP